MSPETLQTLGVLAIGLGFALIGLGGFSTYHASQKLQHAAELREVEKKGEYTQEIQALLLRNQELERKAAEKAQESPPPPPPSPTPPAASYYPPTSPPPPFPYTAPVAKRAPGEDMPAFSPPEESRQMPITSVEPPAPKREPDWGEPEKLHEEAAGRYISSHQRRVIADTLRARGQHTVTIESSYGDAASKAFAEELGAVFAEADWLVRGIDQHRGLPLASGVTISAGSFPPQAETRTVYKALLAAGIAVTQHPDPKQHDIETVVLVGAPM